VERHVKERLIGAVVLVAAAVILIPEMLAGPDRPEAQPQSQTASGSLKTYTIDLSRPSSAGTTMSGSVPDQAPPQETIPVQEPPVADTETTPESAPSAAPTPAAEPQAQVSQTQGTERPTVVEEAPHESRSETPPVAAKAKAPEKSSAISDKSPPTTARPTATGWAVQLGSFASQSTAAKLAKDLRVDGFESFVMPVKSGSATLYRVRIGPMPDRETASRVLSRVKARASGAAVVKHP